MSAQRRGVAIVSGFVVAVGSLGACGSGGSTTAPSGAITNVEVDDQRGKSVVTIEMTDNIFAPQNVRIDPGTKVVWVNRGRAGHNLRAFTEDGFGIGFGSAATVFPDANYEFTFPTEGVFRYWCSLHGSSVTGMVGAVVVGDLELDSSPDENESPPVAGQLRVPQDYATIQAAVDASAPGSLVLVDAGTYHEAITVDAGHENITIRGIDRNETIVDGEFADDRENGFTVLADGVAIENLTAQNFATNAFFWSGVDGYRGSYLNSYRTGDYGLYAFDSVNGQFDHDYAAGSADAGFYIGQCYPCNAVITDSISEWNGLGYSGTNAGGNLLLVNSIWRFNRAGIVPNSGTGETLWPERETTVVGNLVYGNSNANTPAIEIAEIAIGNGILLAGATRNIVERNRVYDHDISGIAAIPLPEKVLDPENPNAIDFDALDNSVRANVLDDNRVADLVNIKNITEASDSGGNCYSDNEFSVSLPADIERVLPCDGEGEGVYEAPIVRFIELFTATKPDGVDYKIAALPPLPVGENMADPLTAPALPASGGTVPMSIDLTAIQVPAAA